MLSDLRSFPFVNRICGWYRRYRKPFWILFGFAVFVNLPLLVLRLTNDYDGLWNQDDYYAGVWELSNGRWFWPFLDKLRFRISLDPLPDIVAIAVFAVSFLLILSVLKLRVNWLTMAAGCIFLASTGITCQLSFSYMSITFAVSTILSVLAVWLAAGIGEREEAAGPSPDRDRKVTAGSDSGQEGTSGKKAAGILLLSGLVISVMMGCYQASLGITCLTALFAFLLELARGHRSGALRFAGRMLTSLIIGGILYLIFLNLCYRVFHSGPASYQGFDQLSPAYLVRHLPAGIAHAYRTFSFTLLGGGFRIFKLVPYRWFRIFYLVLLTGAAVLLVRTFRRDPAGGVLFFAGILLVPLFANSFFLLAPESETHMQMIVPMTLVVPLFLCLMAEIRPAVEKKADQRSAAGDRRKADGKPETPTKRKIAGRYPVQGAASLITVLTAFVFLYSAAGQCVLDEYGMYVGRRAASALADSVMNVVDAQGYDYINGGGLMFIGKPSEAQTYLVGDQFGEANRYAQYGNWSDDLNFNDQLWWKFFRNYKRLHLTIVSRDTEADIASLPEVQAMPCYPAVGSIRNVCGVEVVKLSNSYYERLAEQPASE